MSDKAKKAKAPTLDEKKEQEAQQGALALVEEARGLRVTNDAEYNAAGEFLARVKTAEKLIGTICDPFVKDRHKAWKESVARREKLLAPLKAADGIVRENVRKFALAREQERRMAAAETCENVERIMALEQRGDFAGAVALAEQTAIPASPKSDNLAMRPVWKFEIVDPTLIPREYLAVDEAKIKGVVAALKGDTVIPGVRVYEDMVPAVRGG